MTEKEVSELRRRFTLDKTCIKRVRGCYVGETREVISEFSQSFVTMEREESEKLLNIMKKTLSGQIGKNILDIEFSNQQVVDSPEHSLLMKLRDSELDDDDAVGELCRKIISSYTFDGKYLILLTLDSYDVPAYSKDEVKLEDTAEVFRYVLCSICPVKMTRPGLSYSKEENSFVNTKIQWVISNPEAGFMFPAFDYRQSNIYGALYYTKDSADSHDELAEEIFRSRAPMPAETQKEVFNTILEEAVSEKCSLDVMQNVHQQISSIIEEHKNNKEDETLVLSKRSMTDVLEYSGVDEEHLTEFAKRYDSEFGAEIRLNPKNIVDVKKFEVTLPDITIKVNPERKDLIQAKIIDGVKYIMIRAEEGVSVNGVNIVIEEEPPRQ